MALNPWRDCTDLVTVELSIVFKFCRYCVNASPNFATVTLFTVFEMCRHRVNVDSECLSEFEKKSFGYVLLPHPL